jgi:signal transduction histidine kinase
VRVGGSAIQAEQGFRGAPFREQLYLLTAGACALVLPFFVPDMASMPGGPPPWLTIAVLVMMSALNVEISRALTGGLERSQQPHKALSAWAFACAMLLAPPWLLVVIPVTYAHARWRGLRVPLWKWMGSAAFLVLAALASALVVHTALGGRPNWMAANGARGLATLVLAAAVFLAVEAALFAGSALLNHAEDEVWLRRTLTSRGFYLTESGVLLTGGLLAAVWTGGAWFVLLFVPVYALVQRAALLDPLRERAALAAQLAASNRQLEEVSQFKTDLMGMLAHEVGNPLTSVRGYAELGAESLSAGTLDQGRKAFEVIKRNAHQIQGVLHDIVALVGTNPAELTASPECCLLAPHLHAAAAAQPPNHQPVVSCPEDLTAYVQPGHLDQILANLLSNAHKYAGGATCLQARALDSDRVVISVTDAGPGIPQDFNEQLFQRSARHPSTVATVAGTGIGLFISRALARANGGDLVHRSNHPTGSCFELTLPRQAPPT